MFSNLNKSTFGTTTPGTSFGLGASTANTSSPWGSTGNNQLFGKPAAPAFGAQPSTSFGQPSTSSNSMFPFFSQSNSSGFGSNPSNQSTFGSNVFGQQPATTNLFGSNTFGQQKPTGFGFGTQNQQQPNLFGQSSQPQSSIFQPSGTSNLFSGGGAFGASNVGTGTTIKFTPVTGTDTMQKSGVTTSINTKHHCITCMKEYENKSFEELRLEDYQANRKGPQSQFNSTPFGGTSSMFGQTTENKPAFAPSTGFGQMGGTAFGQQATPSFGLNTQPSTSNSIFGKPPAFGATNSTTTTFGGFNTPTTTNAFGANQNKTFGGTGTTSLFGNTQTPQQTAPFGSNLFGQNNQLSKPVFGGLNQTSTTGAFGQTPAFGQTTQQNTFGSNTFGKPLTFGQNQNTFQLGNQPNLFNNNQQKPGGSLLGTGGGLFGNTSFGTNASSNFLLMNSGSQAPGQGLATENNQEPKALPLLATNQFGHTPFLKGLLPVDKPSSPTLYTTNPQEIKKMLENSKKVDESSNIKVKLKLGPPKTQKSNLFEEGNDEDSNKLYKTSCKRLVLKKKLDDSKQSIFETNSLCNDLSIKESDITQGSDIANQNATSMNGNSDSFVLEMNEKQLLEYMNKLDYIKDKFAFKKTDRSLTLNSTVNESGLGLNQSKIDVGGMGDHSRLEEHRAGFSEMGTNTNDSENGNIKNPLKLQVSSEIAPNDSIPNLNESLRKIGPCGIILNRSEYYTLPSIEDLDTMVSEDGRCMIRGFTVGRRGYGNVYFPDEINVMNMNLDEIVHFRYKEIHMYPDESNKPPVGEGLNRRAQVTLDRVYPRMKETKEIIDNVDQVLAAKFPEQLVEISAKHGLKFVDYRPETGSWVFMVEHFSKYAFTESDEEDCELSVAKQNKKLVIKDKISEERKLPQSPEKIQMETDHAVDSMNGDLVSEYTDDGDQRQGDLLHKSMTIDLEGQEEDFLNPIYEPSDRDIFYHNSQIQVLKAAFFSESECASTISSMDNYVPFKSDILDVKAKVPQRKPPQRPKVWKIYSNIVSRPNDSVLLDASRCYSDFGLFRGKSYKVGWCNGFKNYTVKFPQYSDFDSSLSLNLNTFTTSAINENLVDAVTECMKMARKCSTFTIEGEELIPTFQIIQDRNYLMSCYEIFQKAAQLQGESQYLYKDVWSLCNALWGPGRNTSPFVKSRLSSWLKNSVKDEVPKNKEVDTIEDKLRVIFHHLSCANIMEAAEMAMKAEMPVLAMIISQVNLSKKLKAQMKHQLWCWYKDTISDLISPEVIKIYLLLSGNPSSEDVDVFQGLEWKRAFGLYLWYLTSDGSPLQEAIAEYTKGFSKDNSAAKPVPSYESDENITSYDIRYHILQLYTNNTYRLVKALHPESYTSVKTDFQLSWLLMLFFQSINVGLMDDCEITQLHTSFSSQLEENGLWQFAILPLLYLKNNLLKKNLVMGILNRNLDTEEDLLVTNELLEDFQVPFAWIDTVKSWKKEFVTSK